MKLFIDDMRDPPNDGWVVVRSSDAAINHVEQHGMPDFISFDHDLGGDDTTMVFLKKLYEIASLNNLKPPEYQIHSANPIGKLNIQSFMESWKKVCQ